MQAARLHDVATRAGVSLATASLALSGKGRISSDVRSRVQIAAGELGYMTRRGAASRLPAAQGTYGILHAEDRGYEWGFIRPALLELERVLHGKGLAPVLIPFAAGTPPEHVLRMVESCGACAVFAIQYTDEKALSTMEARGIRVVVINSSQFQDRFYSVCVDDFQGAYEGTLSLVSLGHRSIAFVEYERPEAPAVVADRFVGFRKALDEHGLAFAPAHRITVPFMDARLLGKRLGDLYSRPDPPTAVFAHDDYLGLYVIEALAGIGRTVPRDVSLVAPGDLLDYRAPLVPQITTMRINMSLLARIAANLMLDRGSGDGDGVHVLKVKEQLVARASCRALQEARK